MHEEELPQNELGEEDESEDEKENVPDNAVKKTLQGQPLGNSDEKVALKKTVSKKPTTQKLVDEALEELNERGGSSAEAIRKFIMNKNPDMIEDRLKIQIKRYIKSCLTDGTMTQIKRSFKLTKKHSTKKKQMETKKRNDKKENQKIKEKGKGKVEEQTLKSKKKAKEAKDAKDAKGLNKTKSPNEKLKANKTIETKKPKEENTKAKSKIDKVRKLDNANVSAKTTNSKNMQTKKSTNKVSRKSINLVVRPTSPRPKTMKKPKTTAAIPQKKIISTAAKTGDPAASTSASVKATGRGKKK